MVPAITLDEDAVGVGPATKEYIMRIDQLLHAKLNCVLGGSPIESLAEDIGIVGPMTPSAPR